MVMKKTKARGGKMKMALARCVAVLRSKRCVAAVL